MSDEKQVVPGEAPGDRVAGLSIRKDGTVDQFNPTFIGDRETALDLTRTQLRQQTASNAHREADRAAAAGDLPPQDVEDPEIQARKDRNEQAIKAADSAAEKIVGELFVGDDKPATSAQADKPTPRAPKAQ